MKTMTFKTFALQVIAAASVFALTDHAHARSALHQKVIIYPDGHFQSGYFYTAADLPRLSGHRFSASSPSYLIGTFAYLGVVQGEPSFSPVLKILPLHAFSRTYQPPTSRTALRVRFFNNAPRNLALGKAIVPNPRSPLTLKTANRRIRRSSIRLQPIASNIIS